MKGEKSEATLDDGDGKKPVTKQQASLNGILKSYTFFEETQKRVSTMYRSTHFKNL